MTKLHEVCIFLKTPRLRGLLALNMAVAAASAMVIVNTVVLVQADFGFSQRSTAIALAFFGVVHGIGSGSPQTPRQHERPYADACRYGAFSHWPGVRHFPEGLHHAGCALGTAGGGLFTFSDTGWSLRRSSTAEDRPALFAAQFALSHSCWLVTYPLAGWVGAAWGTQASFIALTVVATLSLVTAVLIWRPEHEVYAQVHSHKDPETNNESTHEHDFVIDDEHPSWPKKEK
jgi:hypothetical protein